MSKAQTSPQKLSFYPAALIPAKPSTAASPCHVWIKLCLTGNTSHMSFDGYLYPKQPHPVLNGCIEQAMDIFHILRGRAIQQAKLFRSVMGGAKEGLFLSKLA